MATQDAPAFMTRKIAALALLIVGGLFAAYGLNYGVMGYTLTGLFVAALGVLLLVLKIMARNQDHD